MEDYLITCQASFVDTESGDVIFQTQFSKPMSCLLNTDILKYIDSFKRGVCQRKHVALTLTVISDRELPKVVEQQIVF